MFYDDDWKEIQHKYPLIAKKLEELRCEVPSQEEHAELEKRVEQLTSIMLKDKIEQDRENERLEFAELLKRVEKLEMNGDAPTQEPRS